MKVALGTWTGSPRPSVACYHGLGVGLPACWPFLILAISVWLCKEGGTIL